MNFGLAVVAFLLTCSGLHAILPLPEIDEVSDKLRYFKAHKDEFDTVFVGSSRTYHQISPEIFDEIMEQNRQPTRSFNFGIDGMNLPESAYVLELILDTKPANLKWVVVELDELQTNWFFQGEGSRRALYWHDWKRTSLVLRKVLGARTGFLWLPSGQKLLHAIFHKGPRSLVVFHTAQFQKNFTNLGRASDLWDYFSGRHPIAKTNWLGLTSDGYRPMKKVMGPAKAKEYEKILSRALEKTKPELVSVYTEKSCRQCASEIRRHGATPVFLVQPTPTVQTELTFRGEAPGAVISFNNARLYPDLFKNEWRIDIAHLNKPAAEGFTRLMANKFAEYLREEKIH
jgi:hypothetical protein